MSLFRPLPPPHTHSRAIGTSENSGVPVLFGGHNLSPLVEIGLADLPKSEGAQGRQACTHKRTSCSGGPEYNTAQSRPLVVLIQQLQPQLANSHNSLKLNHNNNFVNTRNHLCPGHVFLVVPASAAGAA